MNKFDLSVIVLSFNTKNITQECLSRLKVAQAYCEGELNNKVEVIVVENASEDGSLEMIRSDHKWVKLIESSTNTGFSGGNNLAMKQSHNPFTLLLNSDAYVEKDTLEKSLKYFADHPQADLIGVKQHFLDGQFQPSAGYLPTPLNTCLWISGLSLIDGLDTKPIHPKDPAFFQKERPVEWVMGAYFMFRKEVYDQTGGFDESIFMYGEEVEWCKRIKDKAFKMFYVPSIEITHLDKASSKFMLEKPLLNEIKGIVRYFNQHYKAEYPFVKMVMGLSIVLRIIAFSLLGNGQRRKAYWEALKVI